MKDRTWLVILGVATVEGFVFELEPQLGWPFVMTILVAAIQEILRTGREDRNR